LALRDKKAWAFPRGDVPKFATLNIMKDKARWMELCEQAAVEQDPQKLMELVEEINRLLLEKEKRVGIVLPPRSEST
jgi:hypothetical protein